MWTKEVLNWIKFINLYCEKIGAEAYHWTSDETIFNKESRDINIKNFIVVRDQAYIERNPGYKSHHFLTYINLILNQDDIPSTISQETNNEVMDLHLGENGHKFQADFFHLHIKYNTNIDKLK
jgi:hypothetical protein